MGKALVAAIVAALAFPAAAETFAVRGSAQAKALVAPHLESIRAKAGIALDVTATSTGQAVLDVIDGGTELALVAMPLTEAVAAAREAAWAEGRMLVLPALDYRPLEGAGVAFVSRQGIGAKVARVLPVAPRIDEPTR